MNVNLIPCCTWVRRGIAAAEPEKVQLKPEELEQIIKTTEAELKNLDEESDSDNNEEANSSIKKEKTENDMDTEDATDEFEFSKYDDESDLMHCHISGLAIMDEETDAHITVKDKDYQDSEDEDDKIKADDNLVLLGHVEDDASILEVYVYNESEGSFYCHHDILLPSFPLCLEWLNYDTSDEKPGNLCAIGSMSPIIEVWDLDVVDILEPAYKLGRKGNKKKKIKAVGHKDAVLDIAWNIKYPHVLASGSVDQTVLLWDLDNGVPVTKLTCFKDKVQSIKWHPNETHLLLSGSADKNVRLIDCKAENSSKCWKASGEIERVLWNHCNPNIAFVSTDNGFIESIDIRSDTSLFQIKAHEQEISGLSMSSLCPGLLVSTSNDETVKVWDVLNQSKPELIFEQKSKVGAAYCLAANPDTPFVFVSGGDNKSQNLNVYNFIKVSEVSERFKNRKLLETTSNEERPYTEMENQSNGQTIESTGDNDNLVFKISKKSKKIIKTKKKVSKLKP